MKRDQRKNEQGWKNGREQGAEVENVKGEGSKDPLTEPQFDCFWSILFPFCIIFANLLQIMIFNEGSKTKHYSVICNYKFLILT